MLTLQLDHGEGLEFQFGSQDVKRVRCTLWERGQMLLNHVKAGSSIYTEKTLLKDEEFHDVWPGVRLRYFRNPKGVWKIAFDMDKAIKVVRLPHLMEVAQKA